MHTHTRNHMLSYIHVRYAPISLGHIQGKKKQHYLYIQDLMGVLLVDAFNMLSYIV